MVIDLTSIGVGVLKLTNGPAKCLMMIIAIMTTILYTEIHDMLL